MNKREFLELTDGIDGKYLAEAVQRGKTARGKAKAAEPVSDAEVKEVHTMTQNRFSFLRPVFAGLLTVVAAGGAAAWFFIGLPKLRQNPGGTPTESRAEITLPDLSEFGIDTSQFVRAEEPYTGGTEFYNGLEDDQTDSAYVWYYPGIRPSELWVRYDAGTSMMIFDQQGRLRRFLYSVRALEGSADAEKASANANAFTAAVLRGTVPEITLEELDAGDYAFTGAFYSETLWGEMVIDPEGFVWQWSADYTDMDGITVDTAEYDTAAASVFNAAAAGQLDSGKKWEIVNRRFISFAGKVYGLYDVLMGRQERPEDEIDYGTHYFMIDKDRRLPDSDSEPETQQTDSVPDDTPLSGELFGEFDLSQFTKTEQPYRYELPTRIPDRNSDPERDIEYEWRYSYGKPHEDWEEFRGPNGEQILFDRNGNVRVVRVSKETLQSTERLDDAVLKARAEAFLREVADPLKTEMSEGEWFEGALVFGWRADDGMTLRNGTVALNPAGELWYLYHNWYPCQTAENQAEYDAEAIRMSETLIPAGEREVKTRNFMELAGSVYGFYRIGFPDGSELDCEMPGDDYAWFGSGTLPHSKWTVWESDDGSLGAKTDELGRIRYLFRYTNQGQPAGRGHEKDAEKIFRAVDPNFSEEVLPENSTDECCTATHLYQETDTDIYLAYFYPDGTLSFLQILYTGLDEQTDTSPFTAKLEEYQAKLRAQEGWENAQFDTAGCRYRLQEGRLCCYYDITATLSDGSEQHCFMATDGN